MNGLALYNEIDDFAAAWLEQLIAAGQIAPGIVDRRSIEDLDPDYVRQFTQVHFFAGIGVWSRALRDAGWPDDRPVWTGSCPCQPFSAAGKGGGFDDERHLWPAFHWLIEQCRPDVVLGEQVASKDGLAWFDLVSSDLEASGYAAGAADTCAAGFGAPHIRQRLYWCAVANADNARLEGRVEPRRERAGELVAGPGGMASGLAQPHDAERRADLPGRDDNDGSDAGRAQGAGHAGTGGGCGGLADAYRRGSQQQPGDGRSSGVQPETDVSAQRFGELGHVGASAGERPGPTNGHWGDADWLLCRDGKWRPVEPGTFPLVNGASARVGRLRAYGNAICAPQARLFIEAVMEATAP